jgi:small subunit ribosomal protein S29e
MVLTHDLRFKRRGGRMCRFCGGVRGLIRKYGLYTCRKCFRERADAIGFHKYS